ncbi:MAG: ankyrin repeat domain-containing protein [Stenomitos rutilans HA7619-LM2]|jgi:ankyrin repeat protein|nr:ankyrin repeat domain-containing protein [Stenomitos rutilans HA7619-LM2]
MNGVEHHLIYCAARKGLNRVEVIETLIELGSDVNAKNHSGKTALMEAGDQDLIDILLANGANSETKNRNEKSRKAKG